MSKHAANTKPWHKTWWGIIILIITWPISLHWLIWTKAKWNKPYKVIATIGVIILTISFGANSDDKKPETNQPVQNEQVTSAPGEESTNRTENSNSPVSDIEEKPEVEQSPEEATEEKTLGVSYVNMMSYLSNMFTMKQESQVQGKDRWMGQTANQLALLELIGDKDDLSSVSLMFGVPNDAPNVVIENSAILLRFLKNAVPEWNDSSAWATDALEQIAKNPTQEIKETYNGKVVKMTAIKELGMITVIVKPE